MLKSGALFLLNVLFVIGCSKSDSAVAPAVDPMSQKLSPHLNLSNFTKDGCLNLELLSNYFDDLSFEYPGRAVTYDYSSSTDDKALFIRNFGIKETTLRAFPILKNIKQNDCSSVSIETAYGREIPFQIVNYEAHFVQLELASQDNQDLDSALQESYSTEPIFRRIQIRLASPTHFIMTVDAETLHPMCNNKSGFTYSKTTIYRWAGSVNELPATEEISQITYDKVLEAVDPGQVPEVPRPARSEEPERVRPSEVKLELPVEGIKQIQKILPVVALDKSCR